MSNKITYGSRIMSKGIAAAPVLFSSVPSHHTPLLFLLLSTQLETFMKLLSTSASSTTHHRFAFPSSWLPLQPTKNVDSHTYLDEMSIGELWKRRTGEKRRSDLQILTCIRSILANSSILTSHCAQRLESPSLQLKLMRSIQASPSLAACPAGKSSAAKKYFPYMHVNLPSRVRCVRQFSAAARSRYTCSEPIDSVNRQVRCSSDERACTLEQPNTVPAWPYKGKISSSKYNFSNSGTRRKPSWAFLKATEQACVACTQLGKQALVY